MTVIQNPGFEDAGASPGEAAHWVFTSVVQRQGIAGFGPGSPIGWEDFERWHDPRIVPTMSDAAADQIAGAMPPGVDPDGDCGADGGDGCAPWPGEHDGS